MERIAFSAEIEALLRAGDLPVGDLDANEQVHLFASRHDDGALAGVIGVEIHGRSGLLRSLAVASTSRRAGVGRALVDHAEGWASRSGLTALYLLTTTADGFFRRLGYRELPRSAAPQAIRATAEFSSLCPASASLMSKRLGGREEI